VEQSLLSSALRVQKEIAQGSSGGAGFRAALLAVPPLDRDAWVDRALGIEEVTEDGPELPVGSVPYLPCPVDAIVRAVDAASIGPADVFVDVGSGVGRAGLLVHLLTGASVIGVEIQSTLAARARQHAQRLNISRFSVIEGDAVELTGYLMIGTVFFLYCPFGGKRLEKVVDELKPVARTRPLRICAVDVPLPEREWLCPETDRKRDLVVYRSRAHGVGERSGEQSFPVR
jgi:SAM-dependent methyltransferase